MGLHGFAFFYFQNMAVECFVIARIWVQGSVWKLGILTQVVSGFPLSLYRSAGVVPQITPRQLPFTSLPLHYSSMICQDSAVLIFVTVPSVLVVFTGRAEYGLVSLCVATLGRKHRGCCPLICLQLPSPSLASLRFLAVCVCGLIIGIDFTNPREEPRYD
jgi:hypothetical protein